MPRRRDQRRSKSGGSLRIVFNNDHGHNRLFYFLVLLRVFGFLLFGQIDGQELIIPQVFLAGVVAGQLGVVALEFLFLLVGQPFGLAFLVKVYGDIPPTDDHVVAWLELYVMALVFDGVFLMDRDLP